jgi:hypothetical protein
MPLAGMARKRADEPGLHVDAGHGDHLIDVAGDHVAVELAVLEQGGLQLVRVGLIEHAAAGSVQFLHELVVGFVHHHEHVFGRAGRGVVETL